MNATATTLLPAFALFAFIASITPGPNNAMLLGAGLNFGFVRTLPHLCGVTFGFGFMVLCVGLGIGTLLRLVPGLFVAMQIAGAIYLLYLAWKIAHAHAPDSTRAAAPMTFLQAAAFQWINPKAWVMAVSAVSTFSFSRNIVLNALIVALLFTFVNAPAVCVWAAFGTSLRRVLADPKMLKRLNLAMALLLVASLYPVLRDLASL